MPSDFLSGEVREFLHTKEFGYLASADSSGHPYVVPKFVIKVEPERIYLADFVIGRTVQNLRDNPRVSFSIINMDNLMGYQINGVADVLDFGEELEAILPDLHRREMHFSVERIIEGVQRGKKHEHFEATFPSRVAVIKILVEEIIQLSPDGSVQIKNRRYPYGAPAA